MTSSTARHRTASALTAALLSAVVLIATAPLAAQEDTRPWSFENEVGASFFFGATSQSAFLLRSEYGYEGDRLETTLTAGFDYAESEDGAGVGFVSNRAWSSGAVLDYNMDRWAPFIFATVEGSLARSIDSRLTGGLGAKYKFVDSETSKVDLSLAALVERTDPRTEVGLPDEVNTLGRWSTRFRAERKFADDRIEFDFTGFYKPAFEDVSGDYVIDVKTGIAVVLTEAVALKVSLVDIYDSLAEARGSRSNNDGRLFFSVITKLD